uniref:Uncharacterized protein n=1 Tax=Romanomermis culicivorax TaxID=13658 RepID=A0A915IMI6_ROMCU
MQEESENTYLNRSSHAICGRPRWHPVKDGLKQGVRNGMVIGTNNSVQLIKRKSCSVSLLGSTRQQLDIKAR